MLWSGAGRMKTWERMVGGGKGNRGKLHGGSTSGKPMAFNAVVK